MHQTAHSPPRRVVDDVHLGDGVEEEVVAVVHDPVVHLGLQELGVIVVEAEHLEEHEASVAADEGGHVGRLDLLAVLAGGHVALLSTPHLEGQEGQLGHAGPRRLLKHTN